MGEDVDRGLDWVGLPDIATVARLLSHTRRTPGHRPPAEGVAGGGGMLSIRSLSGLQPPATAPDRLL